MDEIITVAIPSYARFTVDTNYFIISLLDYSFSRLFHFFDYFTYFSSHFGSTPRIRCVHHLSYIFHRVSVSRFSNPRISLFFSCSTSRALLSQPSSNIFNNFRPQRALKGTRNVRKQLLSGEKEYTRFT